MRIKLLFLSIFLMSYSYAQSYQEIHRQAIVVDTHNDILMKSVDIGVVFDRISPEKHILIWHDGKKEVSMFNCFRCIVTAMRKTPLLMQTGKWIAWMRWWRVTRTRL